MTRRKRHMTRGTMPEARPNRQEATVRWWTQRKTHACEPPYGSHERTFTLFLEMVAHMSWLSLI